MISKFLRFVLVTTTVTILSQMPASASAQGFSMPVSVDGRDISVNKKIVMPELSIFSEEIIRVPEDYGNIQDAIDNVQDGGSIRITSGIYPVSPGGLTLNNLGKSFTIEAEPSGDVILDGGGINPILRFQNVDLSGGKPVTFIGLTFSDGLSTSDGLAGGVTLNFANATFLDCAFLDNANPRSTGGGGLLATQQSKVFIIESEFWGNSAWSYGGAMAVEENSNAYIHNSLFQNNFTNFVDHDPAAAGGAIHVGNSLLRVTNSRFENNQAGYVGGAIYGIGLWDDPVGSDVMISNSTFINNEAVRHPSVSFAAPTEGGAVHFEDLTYGRIFSSRFIKNTADNGGGLNIYRAHVEVVGSIFRGNQAVAVGSGTGFGGAIAAISNDTLRDGSSNRRSSSLDVDDSFILGSFDDITHSAQIAGGIYAAGDFNRMYGANGVSQIGTVAENRALVNLNNVLMVDLDVSGSASPDGTGVGGAGYFDLVDLNMQDSIVILSDAISGGNESGGGLSIINQSVADMINITVAGNRAGSFGGGLFVQGATLNIFDSRLIENEVEGGRYGAAIFSGQDTNFNLPVNGVVNGCLITGNNGRPLFEDDRDNASFPSAINDLKYEATIIWSTNNAVYENALVGTKTVDELNALVIDRVNTIDTEKSELNSNDFPSSKPAIGDIGSSPSEILVENAYYDTEPPVSYVVYAWSGDGATLNGDPILQNTGWIEVISPNIFELSIDGSSNNETISLAQDPTIDFSAFSVSPGSEVWDLSWSLVSGHYLGHAIHGDVDVAQVQSGTVQINAQSGSRYYLLLIAEEGGDLRSVTLSRMFLPNIER